jgi:hypothetical protein
MLLRDFLQADGGFARNGDRCLTEHDSLRVSEPHPEGDTLGTETGRACLATADAWNV